MSRSKELTKAINAHANWKTKLQQAIASGRSDLRPENLAADNRCVFGQWLLRLPPAEQASEDVRKARELHAAFHREAAAVLEFALQGDTARAQAALGAGSAYAKASADLNAQMLVWKSKLPNP